MSEATVPPAASSDQPDEENTDQQRARFSLLAQAYNEGVTAGGVEEGRRRLRAKLDELSPRPYKVTDPILRYFANGSG